jgi:hypothetical protein
MPYVVVLFLVELGGTHFCMKANQAVWPESKSHCLTLMMDSIICYRKEIHHCVVRMEAS